MGITRLHIALLAVMSLFTGIIAPGTTTVNTALAYPMTDARVFTYVLLFFLIIGFYTASIHAWRFFRYNGILIFGMIAVIFFLTLTGQVTEIKTGLEASGLSWGWIFFVVGIGLLARSYRSDPQEENSSEIRQTIDILLGIVGSFTLACIAGVIVMISFFTFSEKSYQMSIIERLMGSGGLETRSGGIIVSAPATEISALNYDRKSDSLLLSVRNGTNWITSLRDNEGGQYQSGTYYTTIQIGRNLYSISSDGTAYTGTTRMEGTSLIGAHDTLLIHSGSDWNIRSPLVSWSLDFSGMITRPILSGDSKVLAWVARVGSGETIMKMGKREGTLYDDILSLNLSPSGYDTMGLVSMSGSLEIVKNGEKIWNIEPGYISGSYQSNGSHSIYEITREDTHRLVADGEILPNSYDTIREIFLEKNGAAYAYFARPFGGGKYCLFTKYRGNLCGLDGYMNPQFSADGSSILYAALYDGSWKIMRNTEVLVANTGYENSDITSDYIFLDTTNPRTYLFVKKDQSTGTYSLIKNGKKLPGSWNDFGTEVSFGYDNHIIMKLKDRAGWRVAEL